MLLRHVDLVKPEPLENAIDVTRKVLISREEGPHFSMRVFRIEPNGRMPLHTNDVEHEQYVLSGRARIIIGDHEEEVYQGCAFLIPAMVPHSYACVGEEPFEILCVVPNLDDQTIILH
jgi:quercetin dioxygenase-like cupin family protein